MKILSNFLSLFLFLALPACEKDKDPNGDDPNDPNEPALYSWSDIRCKIDGVDWGDCAPGGPFKPGISNTSGQYFVGASFDLTGIERCDYYDEIWNTELFIRINRNVDTGIYLLKGGDQAFFAFNQGLTKIIYATQDSGFVKITRAEHQTNRTMIDGTFEFEAYNADSNQTIHFTNGRFKNIRLDHF